MVWWNPFTWGSGEISSPISYASYAVVRDSPLRLGVGGDIDHTFPFELDLVSQESPVIISLLLIRAENLRLSVDLNDLSFTRDYAPGPERVVYEVIGPAARTGTNELTITVLQGSCRFSDLIVWYTRIKQEF